MKKTLLTILVCLVAMFTIQNKSAAQTTLIHYWHFNNFTWSDTIANSIILPTIAHPGIFGLDADYSVLDTAKAKILYALQSGVSANWPDTTVYGIGFTYIDNYGGSAVNARNGADSGFGLRTRNPSDSMQLLFYIPTTNYQAIVLKYACERSGSGMLQQAYDYSSDSGATWKTTGLSITVDSPATAYSLISVSFSDPSVNNNSKLVFRIKYHGNTQQPNGNNRFDNVTVEGDSTSVSQVTNINPSRPYLLSPNPTTNYIDVQTTVAGTKSILVYNALGQTVLTEMMDDPQISINTVNLKNGNYYISIHENATGKTTILPFVKQ